MVYVITGERGIFTHDITCMNAIKHCQPHLYDDPVYARPSPTGCINQSSAMGDNCLTALYTSCLIIAARAWHTGLAVSCHHGSQQYITRNGDQKYQPAHITYLHFTHFPLNVDIKRFARTISGRESEDS